LFSRISGFASHLFRWFAFSNNFISQCYRTLGLNKSDLLSVQRIAAGNGLGFLIVGKKQNGCQDTAVIVKKEVIWKNFY
jgi:hypothetical protein